MLTSILVGVLTGLASSAAVSFAFLRFYIDKLRPKFAISDQIAWESAGGGGRVYRLKLINKSRFRAYDIKIKLYKVTSTHSGGSLPGNSTPPQIYHFEEIQLSSNEMDCLEKYDEKDPHAFYALQIRCFESLESAWPSNGFLRITVSGCHSLSGLRGSMSHDYTPKSCLRQGSFFCGPDLNVH
jgi:hypothetical protein